MSYYTHSYFSVYMPEFMYVQDKEEQQQTSLESTATYHNIEHLKNFASYPPLSWGKLK